MACGRSCPRQPECGSLRDTTKLPSIERRIGRNDDDDRTFGSGNRGVATLFILLTDRHTIDNKLLTPAVIGINEYSHRITALLSRQPTRRRTDRKA